MNHYETLGISRDATQDDIKLAFRRRAKDAHPDRDGGSAEEMAMVNAAYGVLSDSDRRKHYDHSGQDNLPPPIEFEARNLLMNIFQEALGAPEGEIINGVYQVIAKKEGAIGQQIAQAPIVTAKLKERREKFVLMEGEESSENLMHMVIDQQLANVAGALQNLQHQLEVLKVVREMVKHYMSTETRSMLSGTGTTGTVYIRI